MKRSVKDDAVGQALPAIFSEDACAQAFVDQYAKVLRYVAVTKQWWWNEKRWVKDDHSRAFAFARGMIRKLFTGRTDSEKKKAGSWAFCFGVEKLARSDQRIQATVEMFDAEPKLLGTPDGPVDLRNGTTLLPEPLDYITRSTAMAPAERADCPIFRRFIREVTCGDDELAAYLQRLFGYCLTGETSEEIFAFFYGGGCNGKSTLLNAIAYILGDYAKNAGMETFTQRRHEQEIARLAGARLVTATETEEGRRLNEPLVKRLTGSDKITAIFMHCNSFEFTPTFKIIVSGNEEPELGIVNEAMRRRIHRCRSISSQNTRTPSWRTSFCMKRRPSCAGASTVASSGSGVG